MRTDIGAVPMDDPIAYFITWSTYGTWLPGDQRGWVEYRRGWQLPDPIRQLEAAARMTEDACRLTPEQRDAVHQQIAETCRYRGWTVHAVNCRNEPSAHRGDRTRAPEKGAKPVEGMVYAETEDAGARARARRHDSRELVG